MLVPEKVGYKTKKILLELGTFHSDKRVNMSGRYSTCESTLTQDGFPGGSAGKNSPAMQEMKVLSQVGDDPLQKEMETYPVFLPGKSHGQRGLECNSP